MNKGYLSEYFTGVGSKILTRVDATKKSNQHEINDSNDGAILKILGDQPRKTRPANNPFNAIYIWLQDEQETISIKGYLSWYDTRENKEHRSPEWRLYYRENEVTKLMNEGDTLFLARKNDDTLLFIIVPSDSTIQDEVTWLFGIHPQSGNDFISKEFINGSDKKLDFISRYILDEIGIEFEDPKANELDSIIERFGVKFPPTAEFSGLARLTLPEVEATDDPDAALITWLNHEESLFRRLERKIVAERIKQGFIKDGDVDVDGFIGYSLSVQNRRKSRMGRSLENHLNAIFKAYNLCFVYQAITENNKKPDFLFPGINEYKDPNFNSELLTMLGAKSTCKERWTQILPEAERIKEKHLLTLDLSISESQTRTMKQSKVQLVIPESLRSNYKKEQRKWILSVLNFIEIIKERQIFHGHK